MANPIPDKFLVPALTLTAVMIGRLSQKHHHRSTEMVHQRQPDARMAPVMLEK